MLKDLCTSVPMHMHQATQTSSVKVPERPDMTDIYGLGSAYIQQSWYDEGPVLPESGT